MEESPKSQASDIAAGLNCSINQCLSNSARTIKRNFKTQYSELKLSEDTCMMLSYGLHLLRYLGGCDLPIGLCRPPTTGERT